jgi:malate synthase
VVRHVCEAHKLLARVVGERGGVAVGGMYGVLPEQPVALSTPVAQACLRGLIRDVVTQLRRGLAGFWVGDVRMVRVAMALVVAFKRGPAACQPLVHALITDSAAADKLCDLAFADSTAVDGGLDPDDPLYMRALLAAELSGADRSIRNNHPDEVRYNTSHGIRYMTQWLMGHANKALPVQLPHPTLPQRCEIGMCARCY